jgi:hypothetical protein
MIAAGRIRVKPIGESATFHDPCQIVRRGGLEGAARRVLAALGFKLVELEDHGLTGYCCGGGGGVVSNLRAAPRSQGFAMKRRRKVDATGAKRVTSWECRITLGTRAGGSGGTSGESLLNWWRRLADELAGPVQCPPRTAQSPGSPAAPASRARRDQEFDATRIRRRRRRPPRSAGAASAVLRSRSGRRRSSTRSPRASRRCTSRRSVRARLVVPADVLGRSLPRGSGQNRRGSLARRAGK